MARTRVSTLRERDKSRLSHAIAAKDIHQALDYITKVVREDASIVSLCKLRTFLEHISKRYGEDLYKKLLEELSSGDHVIDRLHITQSQWARIERLSQRWASLYENPGLEHYVQPLVQDLSEFIGCRIQSFPLRERGSDSDLWDFRLFFPDIHLNFFDDEIHMIVVTDSRAGPNEFRMIKEMIHKNEAAMKVTLVLVLGRNDQLRESAKASSMEIVVVDEDDCKAIILSPNSRRVFCHRVARRISVKALQPYQTQGKVRNRMFYGRQDEVKRVKSNLSSSFAIYGGRLIGKSSLLHQIGQEFEQYEEYQICSITAQALKSPVEVCRLILKKLHIPTATHRSILTFERLMRDNLASHTKRVLMLVDEVDDLIALDESEDYQIFETFHNLNSDFGERCRFIFAGYRDLARHCMDSKSRFRNFAEPIRLGNLDPLSARLLIEEPMCEELGFRFESDDLVDRILDMTAGHPNYIQVFCKELSESLEKQQRWRVRLADIEQTFHNPDFRARVIETFYVNFSTLQKLITALVVLEEFDEFGLPRVVKLLRGYGLEMGSEDVYKALRQLEMSFIIEQTRTQYHFIHRLFPEILRKSVSLDSLIDVLLLEL
jgi:hypothetical protein